MQVTVLAGVLSCVQFEGFPTLEPYEPSVALYNSTARAWEARVKRARNLVRRWSKLQNFTLMPVAAEGRFTDAVEIRKRYSGIILVGDSQVRELAWAILKALTPSEELRFGDDSKQMFSEGKTEAARNRSRRRLRSACLPQTVGKLGFTAVCRRSARSSQAGGVCRLFSPLHNASHMEQAKNLWLFRPHDWQGDLSVSPHVCDPEVDFFVHYQCIWGAVPILPYSVPACLHHLFAETKLETYMPRQADQDASGMDSTRTLLWITSGSGLHEMEMCDPSIAPNWQKLPERVLSKFPAHVLKASVLWHTVGGGFTKRQLKRYQGMCANVTARAVADREISWLRSMGVAYTDFAEVAETFAPLMFGNL